MHKSALSVLALVLAAQALVAREAGCCSGITVYGGPGGEVGQLGDGQNRIGQEGLPLGSYCLTPEGGFVDGNGRGCILTPPTTQWQCDVGAAPTLGFSISCNGTISHDGSDTFFACYTGDMSAWNIYSAPLENEPTCTPIWMLLDRCHDECVVTSTLTAPCTTTSSLAPPPPPPSPPPPPPPMPVPPPPKAACPLDLPHDFEFPHLIIPVNLASPDRPYGTSYNGTASHTVSSIFNFDFPESLADKTCNLVFLLPTPDQLETSAYEIGGEGTFTFSYLSDVATKETTYKNAPAVDDVLGTVKLTPGSVTVISERQGCSAGKTISFSMSAVGDSYINFFEDSNPCPIGLYVMPS